MELAPHFGQIIKEMMTLPDDHSAWAYMNPTMYHFGNQIHYEDLIDKEDQYERDFYNWLDGTLFVNQEFKEKTKLTNLQTTQRAVRLHANTAGEILIPEKHEQEESSSVQESSSNETTWGRKNPIDNEESVRMWLNTNMPKAGKRIEDTYDDSNPEEMTVCSVCEKEMLKLDPGINTCQRCLQ